MHDTPDSPLLSNGMDTSSTATGKERPELKTMTDDTSSTTSTSAASQQQKDISFCQENQHEAKRKSAIDAVLSHPELPFHALGLVGRSKEKHAIQDVIDATVPPPTASSTRRSHDVVPQHIMTLISGPSGSGKSALAINFQQQCLDRHAFFVSGKFDLKQMEEPYSAIKAALADLCRQMLALQQVCSASVYSGSGSNTGDIQEEDPRRFSDLQDLFTNGFSASEIQALSKVIPDILKLADLPSNEEADDMSASASALAMTESRHGDVNKTNNSASMGYREQSGRLKFVFQRFIQLSCQFCPVVMVIDDLQWGDKQSMDLLKSWMLMDAGGTSHHSLLFVGCLRSEAAEHSAILQDAIEELKSVQEARSINIVEVNLHDMKVSQVHELVCSLLLPSQKKAVVNIHDTTSSGSSPAIIGGRETLALAQIVHKRTGGNVFFIKQFLQQLCRDNLIYFDQLTQNWAWKSEAEIVEKSTATTNIVNIMKVKMEYIQAARQILPIAACLGATFSKSKLTMVIRSLSIHSDHATFFRQIFDIPRIFKDSWISDILRSCEREGLIESRREPATTRKNSKKRAGKQPAQGRNDECDVYSFVHDKVQEASFSLIPADSVTELQYRVGEALSSCLTASELEDRIFMVASLINLRHDLVPHANRGDRRMKIAMLNNMAGKRAVSCGAFQSALSYFKTAISLLPSDHWESHFEESLHLFSSVAECSFVTSDMEQMQVYATQVINCDCPILKKIRAYHILIDGTTAEMENSLCLFVLSGLGYKFPRNKMAQGVVTLRGILKMKRCVPKWTLQQFDSLPVCTDPKELAITKTLNKLISVAFFSNPGMVPLLTLKLVQRTVDHGISHDAVFSFSLLGLIMGYFMGDYQSAQKLGKISLRLADQMDSQESKSSALFTAHFMCLHWAYPIEDSMSGFLESYRIGMAHGTIEPATWSKCYCMHVQLLTGTPLPVMENEMSRYTKQMKDFHLTAQYHTAAAQLQMIQNLQGKTDNRSLLVGDAYDEEIELTRLEDPQRPLGIKSAKLFAAAYLGDFAIGAEVAAATYAERLKKQAGLILLPPAIFHSGLCCYATCATKSVSSKLRKKYLRTAKKCRANLRDWQAKGNPNCDHFVAILDAEHFALKGKHESVIKHYAIAIALAKRRGYIQDEALAHERLADHLLRGDSSRYNSNAQQCIGRAIELLEEWGATAKVVELREKYAENVAASRNTSDDGVAQV